MALLESTNTHGSTTTFDPLKVLYMVDASKMNKQFNIIVQMEDRETLYLVDDYKQLVKQWEEEAHSGSTKADGS